MAQQSAGAKLSKSELAAIDFLIAHLEERNRAHFEADGFIDSISSAISAVASAVSAAASVVAATAARAATAVADVAEAAAPAVVEAAEAAAPVVEAAAPAVAAIAGAAVRYDAAALRDLISRLDDSNVQSHLNLQALINVRNQYRR